MDTWISFIDSHLQVLISFINYSEMLLRRSKQKGKKRKKKESKTPSNLTNVSCFMWQCVCVCVCSAKEREDMHTEERKNKDFASNK